MSAMSYRRSTLYRFRGLIVLAVFVLSIFFLTSRHYASSDVTDAATIIQWMKDGGFEILLPTARDMARHGSTADELAAAPTSTADSAPSSTIGALDLSLPRDEKVIRLQSELRKQQQPMDPLEKEFFSWRGEEYVKKNKPPPKPAREPAQPIPDPFPLLSQNPLDEVLSKLRVPDVNRPPSHHVPEETPLLIGFTRNWPQLLQCVSSYITAGWPPEDIYVVENTGVMYSNRDNLLTLQNPFYLNHTQLRILGVNVIVTPTIFTFAQLQNFYAWTALERNWTDFFWSHQDVVAFSFEKEFRPHAGGKPSEVANYSLYSRAVAILRYLRQPGIPRWASHFFAYDHLTLVHRDAILDVGGWDTHIPFYATDCDMYDRLKWAGYFQGSTQIGIIIDTSTVLEDIAAFFRIPGAHATFAGDPGPADGESEEEKRRKQDGDILEEMSAEAKEAERRALVDQDGETVEHLVEVAYRMQAVKYIDGGWWRNMWQQRQGGGEGEPFYRDPEGFQVGLDMMIETGRRVFSEKYGHRGCDIDFMGIKAEDAWRLQKDWNPNTEGSGSEGPYW